MLSPDEFRTLGHQVIDWVADFRKELPNLAVQATTKPGEVSSQVSKRAPNSPETIEAILADLDRFVVPGISHFQHPQFHGYFPANASLESVLGDLVSTGLGALGITWQSAPALTELEEVMMEWLREETGLSNRWHGTLHDTASTACLVALLCARERASDFAMGQGGLQDVKQPLVVYASHQAHSSVGKAALLAGYGKDNVRYLDVDPTTFAMRADLLELAIAEDLLQGKKPCAVVGAVGTTGTTAIDPVGDIVRIAAEHSMWVHVDAAMAGSAMLLPECRWMWEGVEGADSLSWNPHKWMGAAVDCSAYFVRDPEHLIRVMSTNPSYLQSAADGQVTQYRDWGIPLGRRFRSLKLWFQIRLDGMDSIRARLRRDLANAQWLREQIANTPDWEVLAPVPLQTLCVIHRPDGLSGDALDAHTLAWASRVNESGGAYVTPSILEGRWMVRISIGALTTERDDVARTWALLQDAANSGR
jgi:aromatic-L-amino-acid/L-tryptophan decarboxylase